MMFRAGVFLGCIIIVFVFENVAYAQTDTIHPVSADTSAYSEDDSVVYVYEEPLVIKQTIISKEVVFKKWFAEFSLAAFTYKDDHVLCDQFSAYKNSIMKSTSNEVGYSIGSSLLYIPGNIIYGLGISYTSFQEKFSCDSIKGIVNRYNYIDLTVNSGIWMFRKQKHISLLVNGAFILSGLLSDKGYTLDYLNPAEPLSNQKASREAPWVNSIKLGAKLLLLNSMPVKIFIEPYSRVNFTSMLRYKNNYYLRSWIIGIQAGIMYTF